MSHTLPIHHLLQSRYRIEKVIGQGGFGITYKAFDERLEKTVCVKELFVSGSSTRGQNFTVQSQSTGGLDFGDFKNRFLQEARKLARFEHPHIVKVLDVFEENQTAYMVMEFVEGITLKQKVENQGKLSFADAKPIMLQLLDAVEEVHRHQMLHRDIKPENVLWTPDEKVVLIDFGSARDMEDGKTLTQTAFLTPGYAPKEQYSIKAKRGTYTDIYALGATFYFLLTGQKPLAAIDRYEETLTPPHHINTQISSQLSSAIMLAMELKPEDRFQTISDFRNALLEQKEIPSPPPPPEVNEEEEAVWKEVCQADKEKYYKLYLYRYPNGKYSDEANKKLEDEFHRKLGIGVLVFCLIGIVIFALISVFSNFSENPNTQEEEIGEEYRQTRLDSIQKQEDDATEDRAWQAAQQANSKSSYDTYLSDYPSGRYNKQARQKIEELSMSSIPAPIQKLIDDMVYVQGGTFTMGCTAEQSSVCGDDEKPAHTVTLSSYSIGKYEVTQAQWRAVMGSNPSHFSSCDNCPVEQVSWNDIQGFITKLNQLTGKKFRLPTEAEWEYAARGGNKSRGYIYSGSDNLSSVAWYSGSKTQPVGQKQANELGLYDMSGNVWEWCSDWFDSYSSGSQTNPAGPFAGTYRVLRGGCWIRYAWICRVAHRGYKGPADRYGSIGFRLALQ